MCLFDWNLLFRFKNKESSSEELLRNGWYEAFILKFSILYTR